MTFALHGDALGAAVLFAAVFALGRVLRLPRAIGRHTRMVLSFSAGIAVAYVFVQMLPELEAAGGAFVGSAEAVGLPFPHRRVHLAAMAGFMLFYGLEHLVARSRAGGEPAHERRAFRLHTGGFAAYVCLVSYLRLRGIEEGAASSVLYLVAIGLHFVCVDHALAREHKELYDRGGRYALAAAAILGWVVATVAELPLGVVVTLLGLVSGAIVVNSMIHELPREKDGRFWPFVAGGLIYAAILLPLA